MSCISLSRLKSSRSIWENLPFEILYKSIVCLTFVQIFMQAIAFYLSSNVSVSPDKQRSYVLCGYSHPNHFCLLFQIRKTQQDIGCWFARGSGALLKKFLLALSSWLRSRSAVLTPKPRVLIEERRLCRFSDMFCLHLNNTKDATKWLSRLQQMKSKVGLEGYNSSVKTLCLIKAAIKNKPILYKSCNESCVQNHSHAHPAALF